ncbi:hypothetical protein C8J38_104304 [Rhizobium sp. PP-WC-2G-219]|nr:hypothetical protein C8J32_106279 [Rhizobium sp. PP-CC-3A-592]PYE43332.1 hypothetical protein DFI02_10436 [Rhizobium sp. PP-F2F-G20b]TCL92504.1 hypothetical protein C8J38_104304 [Rhizobium sp. PP-WC-2G-219]
MTETFDDQKQRRQRRLPSLRLKIAAGILTAFIGMSYAIGTFAAHAPTDVGIGASSCASTLEMLGDAHYDRIVTAWSSGFISGSNTEAIGESRRRDIAAVSEASILRHVRTYCAANLTETLSSAVEMLFTSLPEHH